MRLKNISTTGNEAFSAMIMRRHRTSRTTWKRPDLFLALVSNNHGNAWIKVTGVWNLSLRLLHLKMGFQEGVTKKKDIYNAFAKGAKEFYLGARHDIALRRSYFSFPARRYPPAMSASPAGDEDAVLVPGPLSGRASEGLCLRRALEVSEKRISERIVTKDLTLNMQGSSINTETIKTIAREAVKNISHESTASVTRRDPLRGAAATEALRPDGPIDMDRLTDGVYRRMERRLRTERERRGL